MCIQRENRIMVGCVNVGLANLVFSNLSHQRTYQTCISLLHFKLIEPQGCKALTASFNQPHSSRTYSRNTWMYFEDGPSGHEHWDRSACISRVYTGGQGESLVPAYAHGSVSLPAACVLVRRRGLSLTVTRFRLRLHELLLTTSD